ncbi:MAG: hypothetical protein AAF492_29415 [Verrucomicrobiota bacterium]
MIVNSNFLVVTQYGYDLSWLEGYTDRYVIYDKSDSMPASDRVIKLKNVGYNIYDTFHFICSNYEDLPAVTVFIKGNVFKHCHEEKFRQIVNNTTLTPIEAYEHVPENDAHKKGEDGGYTEINNSWYVAAVGVKRHFDSYNEFLTTLFVDPEIPEWIRFAGFYGISRCLPGFM